MLGFLKILHVFLLATVKYFVTFPYAMFIGFEHEHAVIIVTLGGIAGFVFFYFMSGIFIRNFSRIKNLVLLLLPNFLSLKLKILSRSFSRWQNNRITFNKKNRFLVRLRNKYGFWGIIISTPVLLSIPLGAFLLKKYYSRQRYAFAYMIISIVGWALIFSAIVIVFPTPL